MYPIHIHGSPARFDPQALATTPIMVLVADFPRLRPVLDQCGLAACCGGHLTVPEARREHGLDPAAGVRALGRALAAGSA